LRVPPAELMDRLRDELLARSAFAPDEHGCIGGGPHGDQVIDLLHGLRGAQERPELPQLTKLLAELADFAVLLERPAEVRDDRLEPLHLDRLREVVARSEAKG